MNKELTPCEKLGYKVGDKFIVTGHASCAYTGDILTLTKDDSSNRPFFSGSSVEGFKDFTEVCVYLSHVEKILDKYTRIIHGVEVDVYDILKAFEVACPATQHAIKKLLMPGQRGAKSREDDLNEANQAINRAIQLEKE